MLFVARYVYLVGILCVDGSHRCLMWKFLLAVCTCHWLHARELNSKDSKSLFETSIIHPFCTMDENFRLQDLVQRSCLVICGSHLTRVRWREDLTWGIILLIITTCGITCPYCGLSSFPSMLREKASWFYYFSIWRPQSKFHVTLRLIAEDCETRAWHLVMGLVVF